MTIKDMLVRACDERAGSVALRYKSGGNWRETTYHELLTRTRRVAQLLARLGVRPGDRVGIYLENCPQWPEIYFGIVSTGAAAVPIDAKLREQEVAHILNHSECEVLFSAARGFLVIREAGAALQRLEQVVLIDGDSGIPEAPGGAARVDYESTLLDVAGEADGDEGCFATRSPSTGDTASIIYTSGTTGRQKGAVLTHGNFCSNVRSCLGAFHVDHGDNFLLVLPLHHSFAFTANLLLPIWTGAQISFVESIKTVGENVREVSPTVLLGVPLLLEKMYARIWGGLRSNRLAWAMFRIGLRRPVLRRIHGKLGGKLRMCISGGGPASVDMLEGYARLGIPIVEGYGLTETAPVLTINPPGAPKPGSVGPPIPDVDITVMDPNDEGVGEIAAKGPNIMTGYYRNPEATAEVFRDGWFLTGDLGRVDSDGYLTITGRKKSLIVNREGKNIYPEEVEHAICSSPYIREALALGYCEAGDSGERVGVIVVPDEDALAAAHAAHGKPLSDEEVIALAREEVKKAASVIADYKRPRRVVVRSEEFEKTSTQKIKRYLYTLDADEV